MNPCDAEGLNARLLVRCDLSLVKPGSQSSPVAYFARGSARGHARPAVAISTRRPKLGSR